MDKIGEQINSLNNKVLNLIDEVEDWLEETDPEAKGNEKQ